MTLFWSLAAGMMFLAVLFAVLPLVRRPPVRDEATADRLNVSIRKDQLGELEADVKAGTLAPDRFEEGRIEVERRLLEEAAAGHPEARVTTGGRATAVLVAVALPALAITIYLHFGRIDALAPIPQIAPETAHEVTGAQLASMVQRLADRLKQEPDDAKGWMMLGRSYAVLRRYDDAVVAYARARELAGDDPDLLAAYADALTMASGGTFTPQAVALLDRALQVNPAHPISLWLAGTRAYEAQDYPAALEYWERLARAVPEGSEMAQAAAANIAEVRGLMGEAAPQVAASGPMATTGTPASPAPASAARVGGTVTLSPDLAGRLDPGATLFIFARASEGPRMPLAILRRTAADLPAAFTLDGTMAMMPALSLARFDRVMVGARVSRSGNATPQSGDLQGLVGPVAVGTTDLSVVIDEVVP